MTIGIMQPYFFPYIGYYQLVNAVEKFVVFDDVNFITRGWIHRNNFLIGGAARLITIPLKQVSQHRRINEIEVDDAQSWREKFVKTLVNAYKRAPIFEIVFPMIERIVKSDERRIAKLAAMSVRTIAEYLGMNVAFSETSSVYNNQNLRAETRILDICKQESATRYLNPIGGRELYSGEMFARENIQLRFLEAKPISYAQFNGHFVPSLSMIDVLMFNDKERVQQLLQQYELHSA